MMNQEWLDKLKSDPNVSGVTLTLIADIERLQKKADTLYKAAYAIADEIADKEAMGAEFDEEGFLEVSLHKEDIESFFAVVYNWGKDYDHQT